MWVCIYSRHEVELPQEALYRQHGDVSNVNVADVQQRRIADALRSDYGDVVARG